MKVKSGKYLNSKNALVEVFVSDDNETRWSVRDMVQTPNRKMYAYYWYDGKGINSPDLVERITDQ